MWAEERRERRRAVRGGLGKMLVVMIEEGRGVRGRRGGRGRERA